MERLQKLPGRRGPKVEIASLSQKGKRSWVDPVVERISICRCQFLSLTYKRLKFLRAGM
jgi:hypothetical protein